MGKEQDITMAEKMNNKCFPDIEKLAKGVRADEQQIHEILDFIDKRFDCADFRLICILRCLYDYKSLITDGTLARMKHTVLNFKYWMDEPGQDSMCYWSENHQLLFAACEYLAGRLYPDEAFGNNGMTGRQRMKRAKERLEGWFESRFRLGFVEWHSNTYYEEDISPLSLLIDCCDDKIIVQKAAMLMDLLLLDMALHSFQGYFSATSGRCYEQQKKHPDRQDTLDIAEKAFGSGHVKQYDYTRLSADFIICRGYKTPPAIREIAHCRESAEIHASMGLGLNEVKEHFPDSRDMDGRGMYLWSMEAFTNPQSVNLTLRIYNAWKLSTNDFLKNISKMDIPVLKQLGLMPMAIRLLNPVTQGIAIQRANSYTYRTESYMLSTAQSYHPGEFGDQQHIWQASLPKGISVFTTHPGAAFFEDNARNFSPDYWVGNGVHPHAAGHKNVILCLYDLRVRKGLLEKERQIFTHAWFPFDRFEETVLEKHMAAGQSGDGYIALLSIESMADGQPNELIQKGVVTGWAAITGDSKSHGSFSKFLELIRSAAFTLNKNRLMLKYDSHKYELQYKQNFKVDGNILKTEYPRLDCPYVKVPRNPGVYIISCSGHSLKLDWPSLTRSCCRH